MKTFLANISRQLHHGIAWRWFHTTLRHPERNEFGGDSEDPLTIYAQNGFLDLNMTGSNSSYRYGTVYCTDDYTESCNINQAANAWDAWSCDTNGASTCNTGIVTTTTPTFEPTLNPTLPVIEIETTSSTSNGQGIETSVSSDDDIGTTITTKMAEETELSRNESVRWSRYIIYAVIGICAVSSLVFVILIKAYLRRKSKQVSDEKDIADLEDHPSLNPDSSKFVPGKVATTSAQRDKIEMIEVKDSVSPPMDSDKQRTPSSSEVDIPDSPSLVVGPETGDDV